MTRFLKTYWEILILLVIGIILIVLKRNPEPAGPDNTHYFNTILAENPQERSDENTDYIGIWISGDDGFYEFPSFVDKDIIRKLKKGDRITFHASRGSSSMTYPWHGKSYKTYTICSAASPTYGTILEFSRYNGYNTYFFNTIFPVLLAITILVISISFISDIKDRKIKKSLAALQPGATEDIGNPIDLKPNLLSYLMRYGILAILLIGTGGYLIYKPNNHAYSGSPLLALGILWFFYYILMHHKTNYSINKDGVCIHSGIFKPRITEIPYHTIKGITYRQAFYEAPVNIGTVLIDNGKTAEGDIAYTMLTGIANHKQIARLIASRSRIEPV